MLRDEVPSFEELQNPLQWYNPKKYYFNFISIFLRTVGQLSDGMRIGYIHGFDSGMIMNYVYENVPNGRFYLGEMLDAVFLNQITCKAFRAIKIIQINMIKDFLEGRDGKQTFIADLASGKADYLYDILKATSSNIKVLLRDINEITLKESKATAEKLNLIDKVNFELGDALDNESLKKISFKPDLVIELGLYGIIHDDKLIRKHFYELRDILNPGAILFNVQTFNPQIELISRILKNQEGERCVWHLRSAELVIGWAEQAGFKDPKITMDPYGIYSVVMMRS